MNVDIVQLVLLIITILTASSKTTYKMISKFSNLEFKLDSKFSNLEKKILKSDYKIEDVVQRLNEIETEFKEVKTWVLLQQTKEKLKRKEYDDTNYSE